MGISTAIENTLASALESIPVHGASPPNRGAVKFRLPRMSKRFLIPSKSKKNASLRAPAKNVQSPDRTTWASGPNETGPEETTCSPTASAERACAPVATWTSKVWLPSTGGANTKLIATSSRWSPSVSIPNR